MTRSLELSGFEQKTSTNFGPLKWMAPESILQKIYSEKSDVYMFGLTMWEIYCGMEPYPKMNSVNVAMNVVKNGLRPKINHIVNMTNGIQDREFPQEYLQIMQSCWNNDPRQRPTFAQIHASLMQLTSKPF